MSSKTPRTCAERILRELAYAGTAVVVVIAILVIIQFTRGLPLASVVNPVGFGCQAVRDGVPPEDYKDNPLSELRMEVVGYECSSWSFFVVIGATLAVWIVLRTLSLATSSLARRRRRGSNPTPVSSGRTKRDQG